MEVGDSNIFFYKMPWKAEGTQFVQRFPPDRTFSATGASIKPNHGPLIFDISFFKSLTTVFSGERNL